VEFLDPSALAKLETLQVKARVIVEGAITGLHRARLHGSSVEFAQHKEYSPGDEIRHLDWKVYGKQDRYYVKQFEQESELTAYLVLDASGSMAYRGKGRLSKLEYASYLLAALAHLLIKQRDKVGLLVFGEASLDRYVPPRARPAHLHDLLAVIEEVHATGARGDEPLGVALDRLAELARRGRSMFVLASDLFDPTGRGLEVLHHLRARRHDVAIFQTLDRDELELPFDGMTLFRSLEGDRKLLANPAAIRRQYQRRLASFLAGVRESCLSSGVRYHLAPTDRPIEEAVLELLSHAEGGSA
jgi:uncharacterized protein (DUF58 family)